MLRAAALVSVTVALCAAVPSVAAPTTATALPAAVLAVIGEIAFNPLHEDFRSSGRPLVLPPGTPRPVTIPLPRQGDFAARMDTLRQGPLGALTPGVLYRLEGTRLLFVNAGTVKESAVGLSRTGQVSVNGRHPLTPYAELAHGTGVVGAAVSSRSGTAPNAVALFVAGPIDASYGWLTGRPWVSTSTTSAFASSADPCYGTDAVRRLWGEGHIPFTAAGNTEGSASAVLSTPHGLSEMYQVGGVDDAGRPWTPRVMPDDPLLGLIGPLRPYETGELFAFDAPDFASFDGRQGFGGTSGASPRTAGRALVLMEEARRLLRDVDAGPEPRGRAPRGLRGPLADGDLSRDELVQVLHRSSAPSLAASPARHAVEGYGAVTDASTALAREVVRGRIALPVRLDEDAAQATVDAARDAIFTARGCT